MFRGGAVNPYDDIVAKATDENQTSENWEILLNLCDKVSEEGEQGARNVVAALLKRLTHRNANVQLYALSVAEALSKNCDITVHREIASKAFTQGLEKLATDRNGHEKVKKRTLALIKLWSGEFAYDPQLGLMQECYSSLKAKGMQFEGLDDTPAPTYDDEARRREEEELQRVLEMSLHDKGGRDRWAEYTSYGSGGASGSGGAGASSAGPAYTPAARPAVASTSRQDTIPAAAPAPAPAPVPVATPAPAPAPAPVAAPTYEAPAPTAQSPTAGAAPLDPSTLQIVKRVKALHDFAATEAGELSFKKGDIIKVVDRCYKDWWRGQIKGRVGLLPVNYVEPLPEPTAAELAKEVEDEALVWAQGGAIDSLLQKLREFDPANENLNDNEEIQELYRSSMSLRPKILRLIDKYSQKKAELVVMNERYVKARNTFERMMEESVAKHNPAAAMYEYGQPQGPPEPYGRADNRAVSGYGWTQTMYGPPEAPAGYPGYQQQQPQQHPPQQHPPVQNVPQEYPPQPYGQPTYPQEQYPQQQPQQQPQQPQQQQYGYGYPQPGQDPQQQQQQQQQYQQQYGPQGQQPPHAQGQQPPHPQGQQPPQQQQQQQPQQQYQPPQAQAQPQIQQAYSYGGDPHSPAAQQQGPPAQTPALQQQQPPAEQQHAYGQPPAEQQQHVYGQPPAEQQPHPYGQPPAEQQPHAYQPQQPVEQQPQHAYAPQPEAQAQQGYQAQPYQAQQPQPEQAQSPQVQTQHQPQAQAQAQPQAQAQAQVQQEPQPQAQAQAQAAQPDAGPPYVWNGTANYPNAGACQWAEYYLGGGDDLSGLVYFTTPDGKPLTAVPPRGDPGVQALQQGFANVHLGEGQVQGA